MNPDTIKLPVPGDPIRARDQRHMLEALREQARTSGAMRVSGGLLSGTARVIVGVIQSFIFSPPVHAVRVSIGGATVDAVVPWTFSEVSRGGITYVYSDINTRVADGTETQVLTPSYAVGDAVAIFFDGLLWRDLNVDGRQWAAVP